MLNSTWGDNCCGLKNELLSGIKKDCGWVLKGIMLGSPNKKEESKTTSS